MVLVILGRWGRSVLNILVFQTFWSSKLPITHIHLLWSKKVKNVLEVYDSSVQLTKVWMLKIDGFDEASSRVFFYVQGKWSKLLYSNRTRQHKIDGGLCLHPRLPQLQKIFSLLHSHPLSSNEKWQWYSNLTFLVYLAVLTLASWIFLCQLKF